MRCVIKHLLFFFLSGKLVLRLTGSFAPPLPLTDVSFLSPALELRRVFRLTVYLLRARVPQVIPSVDHQEKTARGKKARAMNSRILSAVFMVSAPHNLFNYRARTPWHCFIRVYSNFRASRKRNRNTDINWS